MTQERFFYTTKVAGESVLKAQRKTITITVKLVV